MDTANTYEIRLFDRTLVEFSFEDQMFGEETVLRDYDDSALHLMPYGLGLDSFGIQQWMESRSLPVNRRFAEELCQSVGLCVNDTAGIYRVGLGLSLNDSYWVVPKGFDGKFADFNLYENPFSQALSAVAYTGNIPRDVRRGLTPDLTTDGTLRKAWRIADDGTRVLYKGCGEHFDPGEVPSEVAASNLADAVGVEHVTYEHAQWKGTECSTCACFTTPDVSYAPFAVATGLTGMPGAFWSCKNVSSETFESLCDMLTLDALTCNSDRHLTNFGFLRDNATGDITSLAPVFDNGRSFFPNLSDRALDGLWSAAEVAKPAVGAATFVDNVARFVGPRQREIALRALEYNLDFDGLVSDERQEAMTSLMHHNAEMISKLPLVDRDMLFSALDRASANFLLGADAHIVRARPTEQIPRNGVAEHVDVR